MKSVTIKEIELINYRQFLKQKIEFKKIKNRNMVIIEGKNGFGKSNIFNAITWCFFGEEQHLKTDDRSLPICNTGEFKKATQDKKIETCVKVTLETDEGIKEIERRMASYKTKDGTCYSDKSELKITEQIGKNWKIAPYPTFIISRIIPKDMGHFFFIDGEKLRQLFENINPEEIKKSIFELSQITLLQNAIDHLNSFKGTFRKDLKGKESSIDPFEETLENLEEEIKSDKVLLEKLKKDRNEAYLNKKKLDEEIQGIDNQGVKLLEEQRKRYENEIQYLEEGHREKREDYLKYLFKMAPILVAKKSIDKTLTMISKMESGHKLPPRVEATFLKELLERNKCICGRNLKKKEDSDARKELEKLLEDAEYSAIANDTVTLRYQLKALLGDKDKFNKQIAVFGDKLNEIETNLSEKQKLLKEVETKIGNIDVEKVKRIHEDRQKYINAIQECNSKIGRLDENIRFNERKYSDVEKMYKKELDKKTEFKRVSEKIDICDKSIAQLEIVKQKIMVEIKKEIEKKTKDCWCKLISAKNFDSLAIKDDYELRVEKDGFNAVTSLSAAETLCLGYSFMSALRQASGFMVPIVIDTPLAKIDKEYRKNVADWFNNTLNDAQVILLVTDSEYTKEFAQAIKQSVAQEFELKYNEKTNVSEVVENG